MFFPKFGWAQYIWRKSSFAWGLVKKWWERKLIGVWGACGWSEMLGARQLSLCVFVGYNGEGGGPDEEVHVGQSYLVLCCNFLQSFSLSLCVSRFPLLVWRKLPRWVPPPGWYSGHLAWRIICQQCYLKVCVLHYNYIVDKRITIAFLDLKLSILMLLFSLTLFSLPLVDWV